MSLVCQIVVTSVMATTGFVLLSIAAVALGGAVGLATLGLPTLMCAGFAWLDVRNRWRWAVMEEAQGRPGLRSVG